jgi:hypothetical protein
MALAPIFDTKFYLENNADVAANWGGTALSHYLAWGASEGRAPNMLGLMPSITGPTTLTWRALPLSSCSSIMRTFGYAEGRAPSALYENLMPPIILRTTPTWEPGGITAAHRVEPLPGVRYC